MQQIGISSLEMSSTVLDKLQNPEKLTAACICESSGSSYSTNCPTPYLSGLTSFLVVLQHSHE